MRALVFVLAVLVAEPARAWCVLLCGPEQQLQGSEAADRLTNWIGPMPPGVEVVGLAEGGFQDVTIQVRLLVNEKGLRPVLALLRVKKEALTVRDDLYMGPDAPRWFDWDSHENLRSAGGHTRWLDGLTVAVAPDPDVPGHWRLYLWGFTT